MFPVHIIGHAGSGKTTLIVDLIDAFCASGFSVGTLKHTAHPHELDRPGKDTFLHRHAGASPAAMVTSKMSAVYLPAGPQTTPKELLQKYFDSVDIVLIEGWISSKK